MKIKTLPLLFLSFVGFGQKNSAEIIKNAVEFAKNEKYDLSIREFQKIPINDTNYLNAQYETALVYFNAKNYDSSIYVFNKLLGLNYGKINEPKVYGMIAQNYEAKKEFTKAFEIYDKALLKYPKNNFIRFAQGVTHEANDDFDNAVISYEKAIENSVMHTKSHLRLGWLAANEGRFAESILSLTMYLLLEENNENRKQVRNILESICSGSFVAKPKGTKFDDEGEMMEQLNVFIKNKVALQKKYKTEYTFESPIYRQLHLMLSNVKYDTEEHGYFYQMYLPFFKEIYDKGHLDGLVNMLYSGTENTKIAAKTGANNAKTIAFRQVLGQIWKNKMFQKYMDFNGKKQYVYVFYRSNSIDYIVPFDVVKVKPIGNAVLYNELGQYVGDTPIDENGKVTGHKIEFDPETNHKVYDKNYVENELEGVSYFYHDNGKVYQAINYSKDKISDSVKQYFKNGNLQKIILFKNGVKHGKYVSYYATGQIDEEAMYVDGELNGAYNSFYPTGQLKSEEFLEAGKNVKTKKMYYSNGQLSGEYNFQLKNADNFYNGPFKEYYSNGVVKSEGTYKNGQLVGENKRYELDGKVSEVRNYEDKTKESFSAVSYDDQHVKLEEFVVKNNLLDQVILYNDKGEQIKKATKVNKNIEFSRQNNLRKITIEGNYKGDKEVGEWKYYYNNGTIKRKEYYNNGVLIDTVFTFHTNGNIANKSPRVEGKETGLYQEFDPLGNLNREGYMSNNLMVNSWTNYSSKGVVLKRTTLKNDKLWGKQYYYYANGKLKLTEVYNDDEELVKIERFDTLGNANSESNFLEGEELIKDYTNTFVSAKLNYTNNQLNGAFEYIYPNGKVEMKGSYLLGAKVGKWTFYTIDGKISTIKNYENNKLHGEYFEYAENGVLKYKANYFTGDRIGKVYAYYETGKLEAESDYFGGVLHGKVIDYSVDGLITRIRFYDYGALIGYSYSDASGKEVPMIPIGNERIEIKAYFKNGKQSLEQVRVNGLLEGKHLEYYSTGKIKEEIEYKQGENHGVDKKFHPNGNLELVRSYVNDVLDGVAKEYYPSGKLKSEATYIEGFLYGPFKEYNEAGKLIRTIYYYEDDAYKIVTH